MNDTSLFEYANSRNNVKSTENYAEQSYLSNIFIRFKANKGALVGSVLILIVIFFALAGPHMGGFAFDKVNVVDQNLPPRIPIVEKLGIFNGMRDGVNVYKEKGLENVYYYFGTDSLGRDIWTRVWEGTRISLYMALMAVVIDVVFGITYGLVSGYFGGWTDIVMQRIIEILSGIPSLVVVTLLIVVLSPGLATITIALGITGWIGMSRLVRAQVLKLKGQEFILASRCLGAGVFAVIFKDVLPNTIDQVIVSSMFSIPSAIFMESFLAFIGLGIPQPMASLGTLISDGYSSMMTYPHILAAPLVILSILMISFVVVADGLRDAVDPKMKEI